MDRTDSYLMLAAWRTAVAQAEEEAADYYEQEPRTLPI